jgi:hypothetical protein
MKKNTKTIIESIKSRKAENKDVKITFKAFILEIVLKGLKTLSTLREDNPPPELDPVT